jgi:serine phosphatase RsbU (regulator of sigma subunit)
MTVAKTKSAKLKLYTEELPKPAPSPLEAVGSLPAVLRSFAAATGWSLSYVHGAATESAAGGKAGLSWSAPVNPGVGTTLGQLRLEPCDAACSAQARPAAGRKRRASRHPQAGSRAATAAGVEKPPSPAPPEHARALASALAGMLGELVETRHALCEREAELAAGIPLAPRAEEAGHLAARLQAVLRGGAEAVDCQAAALYLLDDATSELKLRSCWGLPADRLTAPARPLQGAVADLEALLGHAVVLEDADLMRHWRVPEDFPAAVCVPVSTPTTILGTLWVYCGRKRDFTARQTNLVEIVAGRLAAELEREILLREGIEAGKLHKQLAAAQRLQNNQLPSISPLLDGWQLAGWTAQADALGGDFHDWFCLADGLLAVAAGHAMERGIEAALAATAMKAALRAHAQYYREAQQTLRRLNLTMWTGSAGDQHGTLFFGLIQTATGKVSCASAGQPGVLLLRADGWQSLSQTAPRLGESPEADCEPFGCQLQPGEVLVIVTEGVRDAADAQGCPLGEAGVAEALLGRLDRPAEELVAAVRSRLEEHGPAAQGRDRTVLVIRRKGIIA